MSTIPIMNWFPLVKLGGKTDIVKGLPGSNPISEDSETGPDKP
jgi:hypothetical protein